MAQQSKDRSPSLPPLTSAPAWATAARPNPEIVAQVRNESADILLVLREGARTFSRVTGPTKEEIAAFPIDQLAERLGAIVEFLRAITYPPHLTTWVDENR